MARLGRLVWLRAAAAAAKAATYGAWETQWGGSELILQLGVLCARAGQCAKPWACVKFAHGQDSPGVCGRQRPPERLRSEGSALGMSRKMCSGVGAAAWACGGVREAGSVRQAAAACELAQAGAALCGVRACCRAGSGTVHLRQARVPSGMRCGGCTHPRHTHRARFRGDPACRRSE